MMDEALVTPSEDELVSKTVSRGSYDDCWEPPPPPSTKKTSYPIIRFTDVPEENKADILDIVTGAIDRFGADYDMATKAIKEDMDKAYGPHWHAIIGESYGFEVTHQNHHILYMFYMGNLGILVWKNNN